MGYSPWSRIRVGHDWASNTNKGSVVACIPAHCPLWLQPHWGGGLPVNSDHPISERYPVLLHLQPQSLLPSWTAAHTTCKNILEWWGVSIYRGSPQVVWEGSPWVNKCSRHHTHQINAWIILGGIGNTWQEMPKELNVFSSTEVMDHTPSHERVLFPVSALWLLRDPLSVQLPAEVLPLGKLQVKQQPEDIICPGRADASSLMLGNPFPTYPVHEHCSPRPRTHMHVYTYTLSHKCAHIHTEIDTQTHRHTQWHKLRHTQGHMYTQTHTQRQTHRNTHPDTHRAGPDHRLRSGFTSLRAKSLGSCPALYDPMDCSLAVSPVHGILQARILEWVAIFSSRRSSQSRDWACISYVSCICRPVLYHSCHLGSPLCHYFKGKKKDHLFIQLCLGFLALSHNLGLSSYLLNVSCWLQPSHGFKGKTTSYKTEKMSRF